MRYLVFIKHTEDYGDKRPPKALMEAMGEFVGDAMAKVVMIAVRPFGGPEGPSVA